MSWLGSARLLALLETGVYLMFSWIFLSDTRNENDEKHKCQSGNFALKNNETNEDAK